MVKIMRYTADQIKQMFARGKKDIFYNSYEWRKLSAEVRKEHHNECLRCAEKGKCSPSEIAHHVKPLRQFPDLAYEKIYFDENGEAHMQLMPLCLECHNEIHGRTYSNVNGFMNEEKW